MRQVVEVLLSTPVLWFGFMWCYAYAAGKMALSEVKYVEGKLHLPSRRDLFWIAAMNALMGGGVAYLVIFQGVFPMFVPE